MLAPMEYSDFNSFEAAVLEKHGSYGLEDRWIVGGQSGGSCWDEGDSTYYALSTDDEPEPEVLDDILDMTMPDLTFREYRALVKTDAVQYTRDSQNEYYGNWTEYRVRTIHLDKLWQAFQDIQAERTVLAERKAAGLD